MDIKPYFSDVFNVNEEYINEYGAFNISLITDLPLFIDPFLLFNSDKREYVRLHDKMIEYLRFLKRKSENENISRGLLQSWYYFSEVKQTWLGFSKGGNTGRGLGHDFARALNENLVVVFKDFGNERITKGSHLEKLCLINSGIGRDMISDFTTNLIKSFLLEYTENFAQKFVAASFTRRFSVQRAYFDYTFERWYPKVYRLPCYSGDFVLLTPRDILTKDDSWINHSDMIDNFEDIPDAIGNEPLRAQVNNYFLNKLPADEEPNKQERQHAAMLTIKKYPQLLDFYIKLKEQNGDQAVAISDLKVSESQELYIQQFGLLIDLLRKTPFYKKPDNTKSESRKRIEFLKDVIENKGGHRIFYLKGKPITREADIHILYRLTWFNTESDVSREVNDGRGPADFKVSRGAKDKTLIEFKLASNSKLKQNLLKQLEIYERASDSQAGFKVIFYFSEEQFLRVKRILKELEMINDMNVFLIDARNDNKPSGSNA